MLDYANQLKRVELSRDRQVEIDSPLTPTEHTQFRSLVGGLSWLSTKGRPDLAFEVSRLQGQSSAPVVQDLLDANRAVTRAKKHADLSLHFPSFHPQCIVAISDASFANMQGGRSQCGHFLLFGDSELAAGNTGRFSAISWRSGRQRRVARSTFGSEMLGLADAVDGGDFLRGLYFELETGKDPRLAEVEGLTQHWCTDSRDLYDTLTKDGVISTSEKRLMLDLSVMRELLARPKDEAHWVSTTQMLADPLTKAMAPEYLLARLSDNLWSFHSDPNVAKSNKRVPQPLSLAELSKKAARPGQSAKKERAV
jgi:hypothetical protein